MTFDTVLEEQKNYNSINDSLYKNYHVHSVHQNWVETSMDLKDMLNFSKLSKENPEN